MFVKSLNLFFQQKNCIKTIAKMKKKFLNTTVNFQRKKQLKAKAEQYLKFPYLDYSECSWLLHMQMVRSRRIRQLAKNKAPGIAPLGFCMLI